MAEMSAQVGSPLRILTIPELNMRRKRRKVRAKRMSRGGILRPGERGRMPGFSRKITRKPTSSRRVSHWKERKSWPMFTKESQQIQDRMAPIGRRKPVRSKREPTIPSRAIRWRAKSDVPKIHPRDGRVQSAVSGDRALVARKRRSLAGRIPLGPIRPGIWKYSERRAKK